MSDRVALVGQGHRERRCEEGGIFEGARRKGVQSLSTAVADGSRGKPITYVSAGAAEERIGGGGEGGTSKLQSSSSVSKVKVSRMNR